MPDGGDADWLFKEVFRRLALVLGNTKSKKNREQLQVIIESVGAIKKLVKPKEMKASQTNMTDLQGGG